VWTNRSAKQFALGHRGGIFTASYSYVVSRPWSVPLERLNRWEADLVERRASLTPGRPPALLTGISALARGGRLWFVIAAVMAMRPGVLRRAARDGTIAAVLASGCTQVLNRLVSRPRPAADHLPARRALVHQPETPSFPSSHSAVAAAFTTAAGHCCPAAAALLSPLACTIAYARIRTRAHWPTDVLGGLILGLVLGEVVHRFARLYGNRVRGVGVGLAATAGAQQPAPTGPHRLKLLAGQHGGVLPARGPGNPELSARAKTTRPTSRASSSRLFGPSRPQRS
jgi:membrane-associated phospholipid phosphatase